jgi:hypothetical protein
MVSRNLPILNTRAFSFEMQLNDGYKVSTMISKIDADFYKAIEAELAALLQEIHGLKETEVQEIKLYLNGGEYGLALGSICIGLGANAIVVNRKTYQRIEALLQKMEMDMGYCADVKVE